MTKVIDLTNTAEDPPHRGGSSLDQARDDFGALSQAERQRVMMKEAYVLALLEMEASPDFALHDRYLHLFVERVSQSFANGRRKGHSVHQIKPPSPRTLRMWRSAYLAADGDPIALCDKRYRGRTRDGASPRD
jgi:hypothetical protein